MKKTTKTRSLTIFLLKGNGESEWLKAPTSLKDYEVTLHADQAATLYVDPSTDKLPGWLSLFKDSVTIAERVVTSSSAAVLIVKRGTHIFAIAFGQGKHLLKPESWVEDFGLKVTLNSVDPGRLRSVDRMSLDAIGQHSQIQASREASISEFGLDTEQDLIRAVTGKPADDAMGKRLTGKDSLQVRLNLSLADLPKFLDTCLTQFASDAYKKPFPWIDQIQEVKSPSKRPMSIWRTSWPN